MRKSEGISSGGLDGESGRVSGSHVSVVGSQVTGVGRARSKTFEEYEKDTTDAWGEEEEEEEDISRLSVPAKLESELKQQHIEAAASSDSAVAPARRREGKGKGELRVSLVAKIFLSSEGVDIQVQMYNIYTCVCCYVYMPRPSSQGWAFRCPVIVCLFDL